MIPVAFVVSVCPYSVTHIQTHLFPPFPNHVTPSSVRNNMKKIQRNHSINIEVENVEILPKRETVYLLPVSPSASWDTGHQTDRRTDGYQTEHNTLHEIR